MTAIERKLATVETITELAPIPNADAIERARIRGWDVVVRKGDFAIGDRVVYFEIDSFLDVADPRFAFLAKHGTKTTPEGDTGHRLRTAKLRGQPSQGLVLPLADFPEVDQDAPAGTDVTALLGVVKWDPPLPAELSGVARGLLPGWTPVTDEERIQNFAPILATYDQAVWVATEKLDGASTTYYRDPGTEHVYAACSRTRDLIRTPESTQYRLADEMDLWGLLDRIAVDRRLRGSRVAVQGEMFGYGIQGNPLGLPDQRFKVFNLLVDGHRIPRQNWPAEVLAMAVPIHNLPFPVTVEGALADVDKLKSKINPERAAEGVVWVALDRTSVVLPDGSVRQASFKVVSNHYLTKHDG